MGELLRKKLPGIATKVVTDTGYMTNVWHRFFRLFTNDAVVLPTNAGYIVYTGTDFVGRTITAGSTKITVDNANGVAGNSMIDIAESMVDHDSLLNTHNLTTDIDHDSLTNYIAAEHIDWTGASANFSTTGTATVAAGSGSETVKVGGIIHVDTTEVGNVGTGQDTLMTYTLPADTMSGNNQLLRITAFGITAANATNKTIKLFFGTSELSAGLAKTKNDESWRLRADVIRTGSATSISLNEYVESDGADNTVTYGTQTEDFTANITIKCTGEGTADNDIIQKGFIIEWLNV